MHVSLYLLNAKKKNYCSFLNTINILENVHVYFYLKSTLLADSTPHIWSDVNKKDFKGSRKRCIGNMTSEERANDRPIGIGSEVPALSGARTRDPASDRRPRLLAAERSGPAGLTTVRPHPSAALPHRLPPRLR